MRVLGEYVRAWRVQDTFYATAQMARPRFDLKYEPNTHWSVEGSFAMSRGQGFHLYDNMQSSFFISYIKPWRRSMADALGKVPVEYPLRLSIGVQTQNFTDFTGGAQTTMLRPIIRLTIF